MNSSVDPYLVMFIIVVVFAIIVIPLVFFRLRNKTQQRMKIAEHGIQRLGRCPVCGGTLKAIDPFKTDQERLHGLMIGAARCTKCGHVEIFNSEEFFVNPRNI